MRVRDITVRGRHRHDMGDIDRLACSIAEVGLLHPIVVRPDGRLIAGQRRLAAVRSLGWEEVLVTVMDLEDIGALLAGAEENTVRKDFLPSEAVAIGRAIRPGIARLARERERAGSPVSGRTQGRTRDLVARAVGLGRESFQRAEEIVSLARSDPEFGDLIARMDESGITWAYREMQRRQVTAKNEAEPPVPPDGRFRVIVVDPPWDAPVDAPYPLMSTEEIYALPVPEKA